LNYGSYFHHPKIGEEETKTRFDAAILISKWMAKRKQQNKTNQPTNQPVFVPGLFGPFSWLFFGYSFGRPSSGVDVVSRPHQPDVYSDVFSLRN